MKLLYFMCFALPLLSANAQTANFWQTISSSPNIYGSLLRGSKPLQWNDELNLISFVHLKPSTYTLSSPTSTDTEYGSVIASISSDCGNSWDSTALFANVSYFARFPQGGICNPLISPCRYDPANAFIVSCGPTVGNGSAYNGNWYASKPLGANYYNNIPGGGNLQQVFPTNGPYTASMSKHDFSAYHFTATDDGLVRSLALLSDHSLTNPMDTAVVLVTGAKDTSASLVWRDTVFHVPSTMRSDGQANFIPRPIMAWNETGTNGYIVVFGSRQGALTCNKGIQPIVYKTNNSGGTWTLESGIDFNNSLFDDIKTKFEGTSQDTNLKVPSFDDKEGVDCAVDANNKLHIFIALKEHRSIHSDSLNVYREYGSERYSWQHLPGRRPYLYDFIYDGANWTYLLIDSMVTESPGTRSTDPGYFYNPWDPDPAFPYAKLELSTRLQMSRTPDGKYLVYTWKETDTILVLNYKKWNCYPGILAKVLGVSNYSLFSDRINVTNPYMGPPAPSTVKFRCMFYFASPKCYFVTSNANGPFLKIPLIVSSNSPYTKVGKVDHWFSLANLNIANVGQNLPPYTWYECPSRLPCMSVAENAYNSAASSQVFPNPAKTNATVRVNLLHGSKVQVEVMNAVGQIVKTVKADGQNGLNSLSIDLSGLASGIYMVNVKVDDASSTKKLIVE